MSISVLEMPHQSKLQATATNRGAEPVAAVTPNVNFSPEDVDSLQRDDAMAGAMVAIILCCAFVVMLGLTIIVNVWTMTATR